MSLAYQPRLNLAINTRTVLVDTNTVRAARGVDADSVLAATDAGELRWVWDVSAAAAAERRVRELRFWAREVIMPEGTRGLTLEQVLECIVPPGRETFAGTQVGQLLMVSRPTMLALYAEMSAVLVGRAITVPRRGLERFLRSRWQGGAR
jgi:hypothetical protein